jgi:hypothetical protein
MEVRETYTVIGFFWVKLLLKIFSGFAVRCCSNFTGTAFVSTNIDEIKPLESCHYIYARTILSHAMILHCSRLRLMEFSR